jgi:cyclophilin family peptidyl-prolyl cis-trans isomerase
LCIRNFYTGLPVKGPIKKLGLLYQESQDNLPINILGSHNEGFFDPLTGQLRQIPLEIILIEGTQKLSYSYSRRFAEPNFEVGEAKFVPETTSKPLLTFETPGLVAFNHPIGNPNGGSSEFFGLQSSATKDGTLKRNMLDGQYAPFGYIIEGFDVFDSLEPGDIIDSTTVDGFGQQNLVKIRSSTFKEVAQGTEEASAKAKNRSSTSKEVAQGTEEASAKAKNRSSTSKEVAQGTEEASAKAKNRSSTSKDLKEGTQEISPKKEAKDTTL